MSWKTGNVSAVGVVAERLRAMAVVAPLRAARNWSITTRLTVLYGVSAFLMLALAVGIAYWSMLANMGRADRKFVHDKIQVLQTILAEHAGESIPLKQEVEWEKIPSQNSRYYAYYSRIVDAARRPLIQTPTIEKALANAEFPAPVSDVPDRAPVSHWRSADGRSYLLAAAWSRADTAGTPRRVIEVALDVTPEWALIHQFQRQMAVVLVVGLLLSAAIANGVARRGMQPLADIARAAECITASRLHERIDPSRWPAELSVLASAFDRMLERLEDSFARLSRFSADIAHELRTPINNLMGEAEVTLSRERSPEAYRHALESGLEEYQRLSRMVERLLFLARVEHARQPLEASRIDVRQVLDGVREFHESVAQDKGVDVRCDGTASLWADPVLLRRAVSNLLDNALRHTPAGGRIRVSASQSPDGSVTVRVQDSGCGIAADDLARVFDRFYRSDAARAADPTGTGLGLAIVRSIMDLHGGEVAVDSVPGEGTTVTLSFPVHGSENRRTP